MKKILVSLAAASIVATAGMADVDFKTSGQAVVYYNTVGDNGTDGADLFSNNGNDNTDGNFGVQLNFDADLKNDFTFGSQISYLGTLGLEKNVVNGTVQGTNAANSNSVALTKLYIAKKMGNTTLKMGRQELPKALSPLAFSEGWSVFKNTFDASLLVNTDIKDTVIVGAYVNKVNSVAGDLVTYNNLSVGSTLGALAVNETAYMLTVQNKSLPMTTVTGSYYALENVANDGASAMWLDVAVADKSLPMGLKAGFQAGNIASEISATDDTNVWGAKVCVTPIKELTVGAAYTSVNDGTFNVQNTGGVKTPLFTQMVGNQAALYNDNNTFMFKATYDVADYGVVGASYAQTDDRSATDDDFAELDVTYKFKAAGVDFLAAYVSQDWDKSTHGTTGDADHQDIVRVVARYNF